MAIRVLIVTDVKLYQQGLQRILEDQGGLTSCGAAATSGEALNTIESCQPDVALVDLAMQDSHGVIRHIVQSNPAPKVLVMGISETDNDIISCAEAGAAGYVTRDSSAQDLLRCVTAVVSNEMDCSPRVAALLMRRISMMSATTTVAAQSGLTPREMDILGLIEEGLSNKQIARRLNIGVSTVKNHVHNVLAKLHVTRRAEAAALIRRNPIA